MKASQEFLKKHPVMESLSLADNQPHSIQILVDKIDSITDDSGKVIEGVAYKVTENGVSKRLFTASSVLIRQLAEIPEDTIVTVQMKKRQTPAGVRSYFEVTKGGAPKPEEQPKETVPEGSEPSLEENEGF